MKIVKAIMQAKIRVTHDGAALYCSALPLLLVEVLRLDMIATTNDLIGRMHKIVRQ